MARRFRRKYPSNPRARASFSAYLKKYGGSRRKSRTTKRTYRKNRSMSKRRLLNTTSTKKRDTMLPWTNMTSSSQTGSTTYTTSPAVITGGVSLAPMTIWCATARDLSPNTGTAAPATQALRTATTCFMKGLNENIEIQISDGVPWQWRRICFTSKLMSQFLLPTSAFSIYNETSNGMMRTINQPTGTLRQNLEAFLFRGAVNVDWNDQIIAPLDTTRVTVLYDKTTTLAAGNEQGSIRKFKRYLPLNKNIVYDDDENGDQENSAYLSVGSKAGMGDLFVVDIFRPRVGSSTSNQLLFSPNTTLYWHEK
ncbi:coat protein [Tecoma stans associated gemykolovirus]|nr:coat protein [Tecoma stans associated gemykolovirus]